MVEENKKFIYLTIYNDIHQKIKDGSWSPGTRLPNELEMMELYRASRGTIRKALDKLEREGFISRKPAIGSFVKFQKIDHALSKMESYSEQMRRIYAEPSSELLAIHIVMNPSQEIAEILQLDKKEKVYCIERIRKADGEPMAYEITYIPQKFCPDLHTHITERASLYEIYEKIYGHKMKSGRIQLEADLANVKTQQILQIKRDSPILKVNCTVTLEDDQPLYHMVCYYIGDKYKFTTILPR